MILYADTAAGVTPEHLEGFFVGWRYPPTPEQHLRILNNSDHIVLARDGRDGRVVGYVAAITDHVWSAHIPFLEVLPSFQDRGVATELMKRILAKVGAMSMVDLVCDPEVQPFYERLGMIPYSAMIIRRAPRSGGHESSQEA